MAKKTLDPKNQKPESKTQITKAFMEAYIDKCGTIEDAEWFSELIDKYPATKTNYITKKEYQDIEIPKVRHEFCLRFFPELVGGKKKKKVSYNDRIKAIIEKKRREAESQ